MQFRWQHGPRWSLFAGLVLSVSLSHAAPAPALDWNPFEHPEKWKAQFTSARYPIQVHYTHASDRTVALHVLQTLEKSWKWETEELGFLAPFPYDPSPRNLYQVFLVRDHGTGVGSIEPSPAPPVPWAAQATYMVLDAWGDFGGVNLESTVHHEFQHARITTVHMDRLKMYALMESNTLTISLSNVQ